MTMPPIAVNYMIWPPLAVDTPLAVIGRTMATLSWFAGPTAQRLRLPCEATPTLVAGTLPTYVSVAALCDMHKIELMDVAQARAALAGEPHVLLVLDREIETDEVLSTAQPLRGSQTLARVKRPAVGTPGPQYYYFGNPDTDMQDAYHAVCLSYWIGGGEDKSLLDASQAELLRLRARAALARQVALFGTGPSLSEALERDHSDSFNIICNTIIKNRDFTARLDPKKIGRAHV